MRDLRTLDFTILKSDCGSKKCYNAVPMIQVIRSEIGIGARHIGCKDGPALIAKNYADAFSNLLWQPPVQLSQEHLPKSHIASLVEAHSRLATLTYNAVKSNNKFIVLGGDHSSAIGTWSGASKALKGDLGLIWIDAHMDSHTFETTPSGNVHGMPVAVLMGHGDSRLTSIATDTPKLIPDHFYEIGQRSYEEGEAKLLSDQNVHVTFMTEVREKGFAITFEKIVQELNSKTSHFGISLDLDSLDPSEVPGVGSPTPGGLTFSELIEGFSILKNYPKLCGIEIVEFNPHLDKDKLTEKKVVQLISFFQEVLS